MARKCDVKDIAEEAGVFVQEFDQLCHECVLDEFAELCDPWELIGHHLGLTQPQLSAIREDYSRTELQRIKMLQKWKESLFRPTYGLLIEAFLKCGKVEQALVVGRRVRGITDTPAKRPAIDTAENIARSSNPSLQVHEIVDDSRDIPSPESQLKRDVKESLRMLDRLFSGVQRQLMKAARVTLDELKSCISTLPSFRSKSPALLLRSVSINEFFHVLKEYCNAQSPDILEDLVEELGDKDTKRKWGDFKQEYREFQQRTKLKDLIGTFRGPETMPPDYKELRMKLGDSWREKTLEDLENLRYQKSLRAWLLKMIEDGSVTVVYFVPSHEIHHQLSDLGGYLHSHDVIRITVDKQVTFKHQGKEIIYKFYSYY